jgi:hypothetical protein
MCEIVEPSGWVEGPVWTEAELDACDARCEAQSDVGTCFAERCDDGERFNDCLTTTLARCAGGPAGDCRAEYEAFVCCLDECFARTDRDSCAQERCGPLGQTFGRCSNDAECGAALLEACVVAE